MKFRELFHIIANDVSFYVGDDSSSLKSKIINLLFNPSLQLVVLHRVGKFFYLHNRYISAMAIEWLQNVLFGCLIANQAEIGQNFRVAHPLGIVIGVAKIENNVTIWHNVTIGSHGKKSCNNASPIIKSGVRIYANAVLVGGITVGEDATIGALAFVNKSVPAGATVVKHNHIL